jgi:hypothetical protein
MPNTSDSRVQEFSARQIKELLALAAQPAETERDWLLKVGDRELLEAVLTEMCGRTGQSGEALVESVCSPETPIEVLIVVKDLAKGLAAKSLGNPQMAAATLLYHLSVASALGFHNQTISSKTQADRVQLYAELAGEFADEDLAAVFERAVEQSSGT